MPIDVPTYSNTAFDLEQVVGKDTVLFLPTLPHKQN